VLAPPLLAVTGGTVVEFEAGPAMVTVALAVGPSDAPAGFESATVNSLLTEALVATGIVICFVLLSPAAHVKVPVSAV
jgi:hypothetical protein